MKRNMLAPSFTNVLCPCQSKGTLLGSSSHPHSLSLSLAPRFWGGGKSTKPPLQDPPPTPPSDLPKVRPSLQMLGRWVRHSSFLRFHGSGLCVRFLCP